MSYCRQLDIEPLVEVHTDEEMEIALNCGAKVIGVNNRNLHTFQLDLGTTERVIRIAEKRGLEWKPSSVTENNKQPDILIAALSGISVSEDVQRFRSAGVSCCLIGETLMQSSDPQATIRALLAEDDRESRPLVKVCGMTRVTDVEIGLRNGAGLIGIIFAPGSPRTATIEQAKDIVRAVRTYGERTKSIESLSPSTSDIQAAASASITASTSLWYKNHMNMLLRITLRQPLTVGVFQNQTPDEVNTMYIK
jgi:anthranilate synthase/indole-3-glycerol phosphate synthase/phosphoribosylanthranilate isomerase